MIRNSTVLYEKFNNGFQVCEEHGIEFEKASGSTQVGLREIIKERYR